MLPEEQELNRLENEQSQLEESVVSAELERETLKTDVARFQRRYYDTVGRLYVELDKLAAGIARKVAAAQPDDATIQANAKVAQDQAQKSAEEAGIIISEPTPPVISPECKKAYKRAAMLMHPDRATTEAERERRNRFMALLNVSHENGDLAAIEKLVLEFGQDPEALTGADIGVRMIKAIRRIAQLRRRAAELQQELDEIMQSEIYQLKKTVEDTEAMGGDPLGDLAKQLLQDLSERKIQFEFAG